MARYRPLASPRSSEPGSAAPTRGLCFSDRHESRDDAAALRSRYAQRFGVSFAGVQLRTDSGAAQRAEQLGARAYTDGREIGFARSVFAPQTPEGQRTIAHELAHVAQIRGGNVAGAAPAMDRRSAELQAHQAAEASMRGATPQVGGLASGARNQLWCDAPRAARRVPNKYTFASAQIRQWLDEGKNVGFQVYRVHLLTLYPAASEQDVQSCLSAFESWGIKGDVRQKLAQARGGPLSVNIEPEFHDVIRAWIKQHKKIDVGALGAPLQGAGGTGDAGAVEGEGEGEGEGSGAGKAGESPQVGLTNEPGKRVEAESLAEAAEKVQAELRAQAAAATPKVTTEDFDGKKRVWPQEYSDPDQRETLLALMKEIVGEPPEKLPEDQDSKTPSSLSADEAALLMKIAQHEMRAAIVAKLKGDGKLKPPTGQTLRMVLDSAIEAAEVEEHAGELGAEIDKKPPTGDPSRIPIENRPVHGALVNLSGALTPGERAVWKLRVDDDRDAFRVPHIYIHWAAFLVDEQGKTVEKVSSENTHHIAVREQGILNDSEFDFTVRTIGHYRVKAIVNHNFFRPAYFEEPFDVEEEPKQSDRQFTENNAGLIDDRKTRSWDATLFEHGGGFDYRLGFQRTGKFQGEPKATTNDELVAALEEQKRKVREQIGKLIDEDPGKKEALEEARTEREKEIDEQIEKIDAQGGKHALAVRGQFTSRVRDIDDAEMQLACSLEEKIVTDENGKQRTRFVLYLHDATARASRKVNHFSAEADSVEAAQRELFMQIAESYPFGTVNVLFQSYSYTRHAPTQDFIQFKKKTDTTAKDIKSVVFDENVDTAVNAIGLVLSLFPPTSVVGVTILVAYNTSKAISENLDDLETGNFQRRKAYIALADLVLNLLPLAPKVVKVGKAAYYVIRLGSVGGTVLLMTAVGLEQVAELRRTHIDVLAAKQARYDSLMKNNKAHPEIASGSLKREIEELKRQTADATKTVFGTLGAQALFLHAVSHGVDVGTRGLKPGPIQTRLLPDIEARGKTIAAWKEQGAFVHEAGVKPRYDYSSQRIVGDEGRIKPQEFNALAREAAVDQRLTEAGVPAKDRAAVAKDIARLDVDVRPGTKTELVRSPNGRSQLHVKRSASTEDIRAAIESTGKSKLPPAQVPESFQPQIKSPAVAAQERRLAQTINSQLSPRAKAKFEHVAVEILPEGALGGTKKRGKLSSDGKRASIQFEGEPRPGMLEEEIAHLEQLADPRFAKQAEHIEAAQGKRWASLNDQARLDAHQSRLELEVDAQTRVIAKLKAQKPATPELAQGIDNAYQNLEQLRAKLADVHAYQAEFGAHGSFGQRPALLETTPELTTKKTTNVVPFKDKWKTMKEKEFIKAYYEEYPNSQLTPDELKDRHRNGQRLNPETSRLKDPTLQDRPAPDIEARVENPQSIDINQLSLSKAQKDKLESLHAERDAAAKARNEAYAKGDVETAGRKAYEMNEASRKIGEAHAEAYMRDRHPDFERLYPQDPNKASRSGDFDLVYVKYGKGKTATGERVVIEVIVIEAKGGTSGLGVRKTRTGLIAQQGTGAYYNDILRSMAETGTPEMQKLAFLLMKLDPKQVGYKVVRAPIEMTAGAKPQSVVVKIEVGDFNITQTMKK